MGWGLRIIAILFAMLTLGVGAWPISLLAIIWVGLSFRRSKRSSGRAPGPAREILPEPGRPWARYCAGSLFFMVAIVASKSGGVFSPIVMAGFGGLVLFWPRIRNGMTASRVTPVKDSVLLRSTFLPFHWHVLVEVKFEPGNQVRAVSALNGRVFIFAGRTVSVFHTVSAFAFGYRSAERRILAKLRRESRRLASRGGYLAPLDGSEASRKLAAGFKRVRIQTDDTETVSTLPFDALVLQVERGRVVSQGAFDLSEGNQGKPCLPLPGQKTKRQPLLWELAELIEEKHGWSGPSEMCTLLATLDATRSDPVGDRLRIVEGDPSQGISVAVPGGAKACLTRPQIRALTAIYT